MKRILSLLTLLVAFALVQAQSNYGTTVIFNPQNPDIPGAGGYYPEDKTLILDGIGDKDADAYVEGICSRLSKVHQMDYSEFCEAVRQVVIVGEFTSDNCREIISAVTNYFPSLDVMDLSRMAADFAEKTYFMHETLKHLILPEQVSSIGSFFFCENLTEITCYAATPPVIMGYSMWGEEQANPFKDPGKVTVYVPDASVELYKASAQWGKAQIEPIGDSVYRLRVNLPHGIEAENYRNMNLVLTHDTDGQQTRYVLSARTNYNFAGLKDANQGTWNVAVYSRAGGCLSSLKNIKIENKVTEVTLPAFPALQTVCAKVNTSALPSSFGTTPETMCQISWFDIYDNLLATGKEVAGVIAGDQVKVQVIPSKSMQKFCHLPSVQTYTVTAGTNQAEVCLEPFREVTLKCVVLDSITRIPLGDYDFHSIRCYDGSDKSFYYKYDRGYFLDGKNRFGPFEITIPEGEYDYTVNLNGYKYAKRYLNTYTMAKDGVLNMEVLLEPGEPNYINANVTMNCTYATELEYQVAIIPNANDPLETGNTFKSYDLSTARISIYDVTQEREVNDVFPIASLFRR